MPFSVPQSPLNHEYEVNLVVRVAVSAPNRAEGHRYAEAIVSDAINHQQREGFYAVGFGEETSLLLVDVEILP